MQLMGIRPRYADEFRHDKRTVPNDMRRTWQVGQVWERHHKIKRMIFLGLNNKEIAEKVGCSPQAISLVRNSKVIKDQLAVMTAAADANAIDVRREIQELAPVCLDLLKDVVGGNGDGKNAAIGLRVRASQDILDRAGHGKVVRTENLHGHFTADELEELKNSARRRAKVNGQVVDAEVTEVS